MNMLSYLRHPRAKSGISFSARPGFVRRASICSLFFVNASLWASESLYCMSKNWFMVPSIFLRYSRNSFGFFSQAAFCSSENFSSLLAAATCAANSGVIQVLERLKEIRVLATALLSGQEDIQGDHERPTRLNLRHNLNSRGAAPNDRDGLAFEGIRIIPPG